MNPSFWQGRRVVVTGHTGFKGSWLSLWLQSMGAQVIGYALAPPTNPNLFDIAHVASGMTSVIGDIRDLSKLQAVITEHQPEVVIHMAAQPLVRYSYQNPVKTYSTNVMGTVRPGKNGWGAKVMAANSSTSKAICSLSACALEFPMKSVVSN